jgi:hypothetical protein
MTTRRVRAQIVTFYSFVSSTAVGLRAQPRPPGREFLDTETKPKNRHSDARTSAKTKIREMTEISDAETGAQNGAFALEETDPRGRPSMRKCPIQRNKCTKSAQV